MLVLNLNELMDIPFTCSCSIIAFPLGELGFSWHLKMVGMQEH